MGKYRNVLLKRRSLRVSEIIGLNAVELFSFVNLRRLMHAVFINKTTFENIQKNNSNAFDDFIYEIQIQKILL